MIKSMNQENQKGASSGVGRVLMLVSLFVCYIASALAGNNASGSLMESNANIVLGPAFSGLSTGQLGSSESNNSGEKLFIVRCSRNRYIGNLLLKSSAFGTNCSNSAPVENDDVFGKANGHAQNDFFIYSIANVNSVSSKAFLYTPMFNYAAEEKYQA